MSDHDELSSSIGVVGQRCLTHCTRQSCRADAYRNGTRFTRVAANATSAATRDIDDGAHCAARRGHARASSGGAPAPGRVSRPSPAAIASWQRLLVAQLERNKRYPPEAGGVQGVTRLAFRLDRRGRVVMSRIAQSSGSAALDQETLALIRRAQPFPAPPADIADDQLSFMVPIHYAAARR